VGPWHQARLFLRKAWERTISKVLPGKTERRLALVVLLTAILPLAAALYLAASMFRQASALWFHPEFGEQLNRSVEVYADYVHAIKDDMKHQTVALATDEPLRTAAKNNHGKVVQERLGVLFPRFPNLVSVQVVSETGELLGSRDRGRPVDESAERSLEIRRPLGDDGDGPQVVATFVVARKRLDELESAGAVVMRYNQLARSKDAVYQGYLNAFTALLGMTALITVVLGIVLARGITKRINRLSMAINLVAEGDWAVRVPVTGSDELTQLAETFNRMLGEMAQSRTRIEYLQRMAAWQEMAQRLAHEIKNPLTPIQLAVEECHQRYPGGDASYTRLLDTTLEIVREEVATLRRLVSNFSNFARLPHAELREFNVQEFLRECRDTMGHLEDPTLGESSADAEPVAMGNVDIEWRLPTDPLPVAMDRQMLRRVLVNLVRNAVQAIRDDNRSAASGEGPGHVLVHAEPMNRGAIIHIEDDGPGVPEPMRDRIFEPYFTTKTDGTGLGLAIVKKIIVEHGGQIEIDKSVALGGAKFSIHLPPQERRRDTAAAREAREVAIKAGVSARRLPPA
jgi:nitrogen fixation/metabolism regulation signal transduction histidine kinase